jgi:prepilin-type N-terminal cleavage/methylation domain-containing protein
MSAFIQRIGRTSSDDQSRRESGVTLIEVTVAMSLMAMVLAMVYGSMWSSTTTATNMQKRTDLLAATRLSLDTFQRDLRQAYTGDSNTPVVESLSATQISFFSPDRATPLHVRRIIYRLNGTQLERSVTPSTNTNGPPWTFGTAGAYQTVLTDVVNASILTYWDANGAATTVPGAVRRVDLTIDVGASLSNPGPQRHTLSINLRSAM